MMTRERIVLDTNVVISGLLWTDSTPALAMERAFRSAHPIATAATLKELMTKLLHPKFDKYISRKRREEALMQLAPLLEIVEVVQQVRASRDPKDDMFLEAAVNGRAEVIVTGDHDLLVLNPFRGISILTPVVYLARPA